MAALYANQAAIRLALRQKIGEYDPGATLNVSETMADAELDQHLTAAMVEINTMVETWTYGSFTTTAAQRYTATEAGFPAGKLGKAVIFYRAIGGTGCSNIGLFGEFGDLSNWLIGLWQGAIGYVDESRLYLAARQAGVLQAYFGGRGTELPDGYVWLTPAPSTGTVVYWFCPVGLLTNPWDVTAEYSKGLMSYAANQAWLSVAAKQSTAVSGDDGTGVKYQTTGGLTPRMCAEKAMADYIRATGHTQAPSISVI